MKCINHDLIQKYIDREASPAEIARVEEHITICEQCAAKLNHQSKLASEIRKLMNLDAAYVIETPVFIKPRGDIRKPVYTIKRLAFEFSAACFVLVVIFFSQKNGPHLINGITNIIPAFATEIDANRPVTQQQMVITIIDPEGNVSEYFE